MFNTFKLWAYGIGAAVIAVAISMFKYRGNKIDTLETELEAAEANAQVVDKVLEAEREVTSFEADNRVAAAKAEARDYDDIQKHFYSI